MSSLTSNQGTKGLKETTLRVYCKSPAFSRCVDPKKSKRSVMERLADCVEICTPEVCQTRGCVRSFCGP